MAAIPKLKITSIKTWVPLFNKVLVKKHDLPNKTQGGIILPDDTKKGIRTGTVISVGPGSIRENGNQIPLSVKPGDEVLVPDYGGTKLELDGTHYHLYQEYEIFGKFV